MSKVIEIADAVTVKINDAHLVPGLVAERTLLPLFELQELKVLKVSVVPKSRKITQGTRVHTIEEIEVDIGIQKKISDDSELVNLLKLTEDMAALFIPERLTNFPGAICVKKENDPIYDPEHLRQFNQFTSVITLTFKVMP
jgi:hypothetical protein